MKTSNKWFLETTKNNEYPAHRYLLDWTKSRCAAYGVNINGEWVEKVFSKPLKFDARHRTFVEVK